MPPTLLAERPNGRSALTLLFVLAVAAGPARAAGDPGAGGSRIYDVKTLAANRWRVPVYNDGRYGLDLSGGSDAAGGTWPYPYHNHYLYGAGLWFGCLVPNPDDSTKTDTLVSFSYDPHSHASEMTPVATRHWEQGPVMPEDRVFSYPDDWPPAPRSRFVTSPALESLVPVENVSLGDMWCVYSDAEPLNHSGRGRPAGIDVYQTVYAWNYQLSEDIFFFIYQVRNSGYETLRRCYLAAVSDPDIGIPQDDMTGFYRVIELPGIAPVRDLGFCGDIDNDEFQEQVWEHGVPGAVGYRFLDGPTDSLGLTAFKRFSRDTDPAKDATQYLTMAGYDYRTGLYQPFDTLDPAPADKRFALSCGPFDLEPGQVERLVVAVFAAPFGGPEQWWEDRPADSLVHLCRMAAFAQFIYDQGWLLPGPPVAPGVTLVPGDNSVRIVWDDVAERTADPYWEKVASRPWPEPGHDPMYRGRDFEGYIVYKSENGSDWSILIQCDLADSILFSYPPVGDSSLPDSLWIQATDRGICYSLVDDDVTNGYSYYYCVAAYDWNYVTTAWDTTQTPPVPLAWDTLVLRTGLSVNHTTIPRWDAANYLDPQTEIITVSGDTVNNGLELTSSVVVPYEVLADTYQVQFLAPGYLGPAVGEYQYYVAKKSDGSLVTDTLSFRYPVGTAVAFSLPVFNGQETRLSLDYDAPAKPVDTAYVVTGSYPTDRVRPARITAGEQKAVWCYRGSDYRVEWTTMGGGQLTARVYDVTNGGIEVMPTRFDTRQGVDANGWCFVNRIAQKPTDTLTTGAALLYIVGGYATLNYTGTNDTLGSRISEIHDGDVWMVTGHKEEGAAAYYNSYWLVARPGMEQVDSSYALDVKVVPNPYIVFNDWELNSDNRRVKFTHLPMTCTIRIFTMSGDLVKTLEHRDDGKHPLDEGGTEGWDLLSDYSLPVVSGVYLFHVESDAGEFFGKLAVIH